MNTPHVPGQVVTSRETLPANDTSKGFDACVDGMVSYSLRRRNRPVSACLANVQRSLICAQHRFADSIFPRRYILKQPDPH